MAEVIDRATAATSSLFDQKGLRLVKDIAPDLPAVTGDRDRLIQVVINLISNAVKFTDAGTITCRADAARRRARRQRHRHRHGHRAGGSAQGVRALQAGRRHAHRQAEGHGPGPADLPRDRRAPRRPDLGRERDRARAARSRSRCRSRPSSVAGRRRRRRRWSWPRSIRQLREQVIVTTPRTAERQPRILVVDDDPNIRELLTQEFTEAGYQVQLAANGREAHRRTCARERPDLVVLDVMMPEMNGFDVAAVLKNDPPTMDIPIVILSIVAGPGARVPPRRRSLSHQADRHRPAVPRGRRAASSRRSRTSACWSSTKTRPRSGR